MHPAEKPPAGARTVADLMQREVVTIAPDASVAELAHLLWVEGVRVVPVVEGDGRVIGSVSGSDLLWLCERFADVPWGDARGAVEGSAARENAAGETGGGRRADAASDAAQGTPTPLTVRDVMNGDVSGLPPDASIAELYRFFRRTGRHRAFVLAKGRLLGVVSISDLLGMVAAAERARRPRRLRRRARAAELP